MNREDFSKVSDDIKCDMVYKIFIYLKCDFEWSSNILTLSAFLLYFLVFENMLRYMSLFCVCGHAYATAHVGG